MKSTAIRALRKRLGLTQVEFAVRLGITQSGVSRLEECGKPSKPVAMLLKQLASTPTGGR